MLSSAMRFSSVAAALGGLVTSVSAIAPISFHGSKFFRADGSQFYMKGAFTQWEELSGCEPASKLAIAACLSLCHVDRSMC